MLGVIDTGRVSDGRDPVGIDHDGEQVGAGHCPGDLVGGVLGIGDVVIQRQRRERSGRGHCLVRNGGDLGSTGATGKHDQVVGLSGGTAVSVIGGDRDGECSQLTDGWSPRDQSRYAIDGHPGRILGQGIANGVTHRRWRDGGIEVIGRRRRRSNRRRGELWGQVGERNHREGVALIEGASASIDGDQHKDTAGVGRGPLHQAGVGANGHGGRSLRQTVGE